MTVIRCGACHAAFVALPTMKYGGDARATRECSVQLVDRECSRELRGPFLMLAPRQIRFLLLIGPYPYNLVTSAALVPNIFDLTFRRARSSRRSTEDAQRKHFGGVQLRPYS